MDRRSFLAGAIGVAAATPVAAAVDTAGQPLLRGTLDGEPTLDLRTKTDDTGGLQALLDGAVADDRQVFLPAGTFIVSELKLPSRTRLAGVPGATRLVFGGGAFMIWSERAEHIELSGLIFDGAGAPLESYVPGLIHLAECADISIDGCTVVDSSASGIALDRSGGRISRTTVRSAADVGISSIEATGLIIADNTIADCGNGGIHVHRWTEGPDDTSVTGNRISGIHANGSGGGFSGNGISVFRAHGVVVAGNRVSDCALTAIRANSASNVQITGNTCRRSGEAGILGEFACEGALIANNAVDGGGTGIALANFSDGARLAVISSNVVRNIVTRPGSSDDSPLAGIGIAVDADATVSGNLVDGAPMAGLRLGWGPHLRDVAATGNVLRRAPVGIAVSVVTDAGPVVVADNLISGASKGAVIGMHWGKAATGDLTQADAGRYPHLMVERNLVS